MGFRQMVLMIILLVCVMKVQGQAGYIDSLQRELATTTNDTMKLKILSMLGEAYVELKPDSSRQYAEQLVAITRKLDYKLKEVYAYGMLGYSLLNLGDYPLALKVFIDAIALGEDPSIETKLLPSKYQDDEQFQHHMNDGHLQRLDELANCQLKFGILYENVNEYDKEKSHILEGIKYVEETGNSSLASALYAVLGKVYLLQGKLDSALVAEKTALAKSRQSQYIKYQGTIFLNLGRIHTEKGDYSTALSYFKQAIKVSDTLHYLRGVAAGNLAIADLYNNSGNPDSSLYYANSALAVSEYLQNPGLMLRTYTAKAKVFRTIKNIDSTVKYQALIIGMKDTVFNTKQTQLFANIDFDAEQRKLELETARKEYRNRLQTSFLISGLAIFFLLAIGLWLNNKQKQKAFSLLEKQKKEIDIQKAKAESALDELKATQSQLIQREKMASLGELTAGIAHEIQNPLNFVNNFSEINSELINDLQNELKSNKVDEANVIAATILDNEQKIMHHGKRADTIVKGMLQHSRTGTGNIESTDINALADEFMRLSFQGFRVREKDFHVALEKKLDPAIGKIDIVQGDIGNVMLNLFNNAFYAVSEKKKLDGNQFEPKVSLSTEKVNGGIEIRVRDNGNGVPLKILDKIFQPFFTTKPAGQGTGLGLSLSYDIVKAYGGEIKVESREGEFAEFILRMPYNT